MASLNPAIASFVSQVPTPAFQPAVSSNEATKFVADSAIPTIDSAVGSSVFAGSTIPAALSSLESRVQALSTVTDQTARQSAVSSLQEEYRNVFAGSVPITGTSTVAKATSGSSVPVSKTSSPSASSTLGEASSQNTSGNYTSTARRGLSAGAIAGIVIGVVVGILILLGLLLYNYRTRRRMRALEAQMRYEKAELPAESISWWQRPFTAKKDTELMARNESTARAELEGDKPEPVEVEGSVVQVRK